MSDELSKQIRQAAEAKGMDVSADMIGEVVQRVLAKLGGDTGAPAAGASGKLNAKKDYPLALKRPDLVRSVTNLSLDEITLEKVVAGKTSFDDIKTSPQTLEYQAQIAESCNRPRLARNLRRAAELTRIPDERVLELYNALRPYRSTKQELLDIADELDNKYQAKICAAHFREAAAVYEKNERLKD